MACADGSCHGCPFNDYGHQYGESWCNNYNSPCPRGYKSRRINYPKEEHSIVN